MTLPGWIIFLTMLALLVGATIVYWRRSQLGDGSIDWESGE